MQRHRSHSLETVEGIPYEELTQMEAARELIHVVLNPHRDEPKQPKPLECGCCSDCGCFCEIMKFDSAAGEAGARAGALAGAAMKGSVGIV